jgi:hypothetical protein
MGLDLNEVMIWWGDPDSGFAMRPQIKALSNRNVNSNFSYLENSVGACFGGWASLPDREKASALLAVFACATGRDRVPADEAHNAFLEIDAYRQWCETDEGPFGDVFRLAHGDNSPSYPETDAERSRVARDMIAGAIKTI